MWLLRKLHQFLLKFFTYFFRKHVQSVDKLSGSRQPSIPYALSHLGKPYDLVNVPEECPNLSNTCQVH